MKIKNNMKNIVQFNLVLENSKMKEDLGIEQLHFSKCSFDLDGVIYYRESVDDDGEPEPYTLIIIDPGISICIDIPYDDFHKLFIEKTK